MLQECERNDFMKDSQDFYTLKGYEIQENKNITYAMEDYLEMIARLSQSQKYIRINELAAKLNVRPSSVSKMMTNLKKVGLVKFEKYGYIELTKEGKQLGKYLIHRHDVLYKFLCLINGSDNELEQVEKIEHYVNTKTIDNIESLYHKIKNKLK